MSTPASDPFPVLARIREHLLSAHSLVGQLGALDGGEAVQVKSRLFSIPGATVEANRLGYPMAEGTVRRAIKEKTLQTVPIEGTGLSGDQVITEAELKRWLAKASRRRARADHASAP